MVWSALAEYKRRPSAEKVNPRVIHEVCPSRAPMLLPESASQRRIGPPEYPLPLARMGALGDHATAVMISGWGVMLRFVLPVPRSTTRRLPSPYPITSDFPSGEKSRAPLWKAP